MTEHGQPLQQKLALTRRWWRMTRAFGGAAWIACVVIALGLICFHADRAFVLSAAAREWWRVGILCAALAILLVAVLRPLLRPLPDKALAEDVERRYPVLKERLLTTIDLIPALATPGAAPALTSSGFSYPMASALASETTRAASGLDFRRAVSLRPLRVSLLTFGFAALLLVLQIALAPGAFAVWLQRMASPRADIAPFAATRVWLAPSADVLPRGEGLNVTVTARGVLPNHGALFYRQEGDAAAPWKSVPLDKGQDDSDSRRFTYHFPSVAQNLELYATANDGRSNTRQVAVENRPTVLNMKMVLHFPAYTKRNAQVVSEATGNIAAPTGTEVELQATANKSLRTADCLRANGEETPWKVEGEKASGKLMVSRPETYTLRLTDRHGFDNPDAPRYSINPLKDQPPAVQITKPGGDIELVPEGSLPLVARATDDYGVAAMHLDYAAVRGEDNETRTNRVKVTTKGAIPLPGPTGAPAANVSQRWFIGDLKAKPGDTVNYLVDAVDTDTVDGPHIARSLSYRIRIVSLAEMQQRLKQQLDDEARALAQLRRKQIEAQQDLEKAKLKPDQSKMARAQDAQRSAAQDARTLSQRVGELTTQLENNNLATKSEIQRRDSAEKTLRDLAQQKMPAAADAVQQAQNSPKSRAESLNQADNKESDIRKEIEKAQQELSRVPPPAQLAAEAQRLAQQQQQLAESSRSLAEDMRVQKAANGGLTPDQKNGLEMERRRQAETQADTQTLMAQMQAAAKAAEERGNKQEADALKRAIQALKQGSALGNQQKAQSQLQQNSPASASSPQSKAAAALQKAAQDAKEAANQTPPDSAQAAASQLEQAAEKLRQLADQQRSVAEKIAQSPGAEQSRKLAQQERSIQQQAGQMQKALSNAAQAQQSLQNAQQSLSQSDQQLSQGSPQSAQSPAQSAQQQLQKAAQQAAKAAEQLRQQQAAAELREKVEALAQRQRLLQIATTRMQFRQENRAMSSNLERELKQLGAQQETLESEVNDLVERFPSQAFKQALKMAARQMHPATKNLQHDPPITDAGTRIAQAEAARTLDATAQALKQQAQGNQQGDQQQQQGGGGQQSGNMSPQQAQQAAALGDLMLARGIQQQLRQETADVDQMRRNSNMQTNKTLQRETDQLAQSERDVQSITQSAQESLQNLPGVPQNLQDARQEAGQAGDQLQQQQTGQPAQTHQENALHSLDQAVMKAQQALQQQQQQQQAQQQAQSGAPMPGPQHGNTPGKRLAPLENVQRGKLSSPNQHTGRGFGTLPPRAQRVLREGEQERVPVEFQDLVSRYRKALAEKK